MIQGKRVELIGNSVPTEPGEYGRAKSGVWWAKPPEPGYPTGMLTDHTVIEHDDGTISVSPSILIEGANGKQWHGYLTRGEWQEV